MLGKVIVLHEEPCFDLACIYYYGGNVQWDCVHAFGCFSKCNKLSNKNKIWQLKLWNLFASGNHFFLTFGDFVILLLAKS